MQTRSKLLGCAALLLPLAAQAAPTRAEDSDPRWHAFLGCWAPLTRDTAEDVQQHVLCFREHESGGVAVTTVVDDEVQSEERILADGAAHQIRRGICAGTGTATWSADGARVYLRSVQRCGESGLARESAGVLALSGDRTLINMQAVGTDDQYGVRVLHYRLLTPAEYPASMGDLAARADDATRMYAAAPLSLEDIIEASGLLPSAGTRAMLVNLPAPDIQVDADALLRLANAGVEEDVIDVVVALAYPEEFAMATAPHMDAGREVYAGGGTGGLYFDPWLGYSRYGYGGYSYSPFGYPYGWGFGGGTVIIVDGDGDAAPDDRGAAVKGHGYTRMDDTPSSGTTRAEPRSESSRSSVDRSSGVRSTSRSSPARGDSVDRGSTRKAQPKRPPSDDN